jgi:hypothetical protein
MTVNKSEIVTIPKWLLIVLLPIIISVSGAWLTVKISNAKSEVTIEMIKAQLNRIEVKLDKHIDK